MSKRPIIIFGKNGYSYSLQQDITIKRCPTETRKFQSTDDKPTVYNITIYGIKTFPLRSHANNTVLWQFFDHLSASFNVLRIKCSKVCA